MTDHPLSTQVNKDEKAEGLQGKRQFGGDRDIMAKNAGYWDYFNGLKRLTEALPDPNDGRIGELRQLIRSGRLITREAIREAAAKLTQQFLSGKLAI